MLQQKLAERKARKAKKQAQGEEEESSPAPPTKARSKRGKDKQEESEEAQEETKDERKERKRRQKEELEELKAKKRDQLKKKGDDFDVVTVMCVDGSGTDLSAQTSPNPLCTSPEPEKASVEEEEPLSPGEDAAEDPPPIMRVSPSGCKCTTHSTTGW